jgi:hemoglobin
MLLFSRSRVPARRIAAGADRVELKGKPVSALFDRLGGAPAVDAAVDIFYRKVLMDDRISHFFEDVDMERQAAKQKGFLTMVTGGPVNYTGADMRTGHAHLVAKGLNDSHVDAVIELLAETLKELGAADADIAEVGALANSVRDDVLNR